MLLSQLNNVLIIRLSSLGDILLSTPLLRALKKENPAMSVDFLLREEYKDTLRFNPYVSSLLFYSRNSNQLLIESIKDKKYDLVVDLQNNLRSHNIVRKISAPSVRFEKRRLDKFLLVKLGINRLKETPAVPERYIASVPGLKADGLGLDLFIPENIKTESLAGRNIGICPGSRHFTKMWPEEYYISLGRMLTEKGYRILLFGGRSDREICLRIASKIEGALDLSNENDLLATAAEMKKCEAIICNDSGMMHTACAAGIPVAVFFGSTVKEFGFYPYKNTNLILENNSLSCRPCSHIGREKCPKGHFNCMLEMTPDRAFDNILKFLK